VNRRLAAHRRKELSVVETGAATTPQEPSTRRAAQAAARVAERYAHVPSYSEMQASEARSALRAAEAATRVALEAQVAAQAALDNLAEEHERLDEEQAAREYRTEPAVSTSDRVGQSSERPVDSHPVGTGYAGLLRSRRSRGAIAPTNSAWPA